MTFASWVHFGEEIDKDHPAFEQNVEEHNYEQEIAVWWCASALTRTESWKGQTRGTAGRCFTRALTNVVLCGSRRTPDLSAWVGLDTRLLEKTWLLANL
jgi:hypothetical protein